MRGEKLLWRGTLKGFISGLCLGWVLFPPSAWAGAVEEEMQRLKEVVQRQTDQLRQSEAALKELQQRLQQLEAGQQQQKREAQAREQALAEVKRVVEKKPEPEALMGGKLKLSGDARLRLERDWDSTQSNGTKRDDRDRVRGRLRFGFDYQYSETVTFGGRLRTGSRESQQSPHVTFGDDFRPKEINVDKLYIRAKVGEGWVWGGKNTFPFWTQNELFWDDDVTPEGVAAGYRLKLGSSGRLDLTAGAFVLDNPEASNDFSDKARLLGGQVAGAWKLPQADLTAAVGYFAFRDNPKVANPALLDLDYRIWVLGLQAAVRGLPKPLVLGVDYMKNTEDYPSTLFNRDETTGYMFSAAYGELKKKSDWLLGYYYAHIEKYAVVPYFAQDDWLRWGTATQTRSSNFQGHEFRVAYALGPKWNLMARLYLVKGIALESATAVAREDGKRFRVDLNIGF